MWDWVFHILITLCLHNLQDGSKSSQTRSNRSNSITSSSQQPYNHLQKCYELMLLSVLLFIKLFRLDDHTIFCGIENTITQTEVICVYLYLSSESSQWICVCVYVYVVMTFSGGWFMYKGKRLHRKHKVNFARFLLDRRNSLQHIQIYNYLFTYGHR